MKVLESNENYLKFVGIFSTRENETKNDFMRSINGWVTLIGIITLFLMSGAYVYQNVFSNLSASIYAFVPCSSGFNTSITFISVGLNIKVIKRLHNRLQTIVDKGKKSPKNCLNYKKI